MSTTITTISGDKALYISGSANYFSRKINVPSGTSDLRVGFYLTLGGNSATASTQTYYPSAVLGETYRHFLTSEGCIPGLTSGSYLGHGQTVTSNHAISRYDAPDRYNVVHNAANFNGNIGFLSSSLYSMTSTGTGNVEVRIKNAPDSASIHVIRLYKSAPTQLQLFMYQRWESAAPVNLGLPIQDSNFDSYMSNIANLNEQRNMTLTFNNGTDRDNMFASMSCVFFAWPYTEVPVYCPYMGYRAT